MSNCTGQDLGGRRLVNRAALIAILMVAGASYIFAQVPINSAGAPHAKRQGRTQEPKMIVDTLRMAAGSARLILKGDFSDTYLRTRPTAQTAFYATVTGLLRDTTEGVKSYGAYLSANCETLIVKSSSATDSGLVSIMAFFK